MLTFSSLFLVLWNYQNWFGAIESFIILEKWMKTLNIRINPKTLILFQYFELFIVMITCLLQFVDCFFRTGVTIILFSCFSVVINIIVLIEFLNCLLLLKLYLKTLNIKMKEISNISNPSNIKVLDKRRFVFSSKTVSRLQNIYALREIHRYLFNCCKFINNLYSIQLVLCIVHNIASVIVILYIILLNILSSSEAFNALMLGTTSLSLNLVKHAAELGIIVFVCTAVCDEVSFIFKKYIKKYLTLVICKG